MPSLAVPPLPDEARQLTNGHARDGGLRILGNDCPGQAAIEVEVQRLGTCCEGVAELETLDVDERAALGPELEELRAPPSDVAAIAQEVAFARHERERADNFFQHPLQEP